MYNFSDNYFVYKNCILGLIIAICSYYAVRTLDSNRLILDREWVIMPNCMEPSSNNIAQSYRAIERRDTFNHYYILLVGVTIWI